MKFGASFIHGHRTAVKHHSVQRRDRALGFHRLRHFHEGDAAGFARIPVLDNGDGFDGSVSGEHFAQLLLSHRDIQVSDKNVSHEFILVFTFAESRNQERRRDFKRRP